ncbi:hypothetical protein ABL78_5385 [Leptomonas seymouri]|uniref:Uncharacterized protein n=1 Tax=Leptomonas seymouri TaxID=5684 RepID=A0A0N0P4Q0_LEPSE|nr:hypothetical protein ABL78_5385 [Leptomonas seymouri]|eukprot:KPI85556.1 hypothetical protein ABL78_5385 [Leptomonas seymouri]
MRSQTARCTAAAAIAGGSGLLGTGAILHNCSPSTSHTASPLHEQRRYSFKYATKRQHNEMRQPFFIHEKRYGLFSNEHNIAKARRGLPHITPIYTKHMSLWETDTDASTNRFFRSYVSGQRDLHILLGRPHGFEADEAGGRQGDAAYELNTDQRYKGAPRPAITNLHYEPQWNQTLYRNTAHGNALANPNSALTATVLGPELMEVRDIKSVEHCKAWFDRLAFLIQQHYDAVGDIGEYRSRHTRHVHDFFVAFHDALSSFDFQDAYLYDQFTKVRPQQLNDIFAIFIEMEANYVNEDYCPRCSLPYATTHYCGEGDANTPFRKHRGRWAPHQQWGREWYDVVMRRAEALWYRATEDPFFGTASHTQRQVEALMSVYVKTKHRAKLVDFVHAIRGSKEYLMGQVEITPEMQQSVDELLDSTAHPHLLTNSHTLESRAAKYTGDAQSVPHSPLQMRLDMEMGKYRRQQKEEGVVRVPPAAWKLDTSAIVHYKIDPQTKRVTNWREVKEGIEKSFLSTGLPKEAYTSEEWREMLYLKERIAGRGARRAQLEGERQSVEAEMVRKYGSASSSSSPKAWRVFPDKDWYRVFETSAEALKPFGVKHSGELLLARIQIYSDPAAVPYTDPIRNASMKLDTTPEACTLFGGFESGEVVRLTPHENSGDGGGEAPFEVVIVGVDKNGAESEWGLYAMYRDATLHTSRGLLSLGSDCLAVLSGYAKVESTGMLAPVTVLDAQRTLSEEHLGQVVGVRKGMLYMQWHLQRGGSSELDRSVAMPLGTPEMVKQLYQLRAMPSDGQSSEKDGGGVLHASSGPPPLQEPPSWRTPFRNDFVDERLKELEQAPFEREQWASLIQGKYTPKVKKFGYTQHTTQDDFQTKEYKDRLLARQFFTNPQAFAVIPERCERSVKFMGKWEHQRVSGLPTVDRDELERGWGEAEEISDAEVGAIEQALRDISGRRPGNFIKSPAETQSLRLNESWWTPLEYGWEQHNREQRAFLDSSERRIIESSRLPFGGKRPPFGTTYGIGERISEIAADYAKGFGLGPHGHSPQHDNTHFNTLGAEERRVKTLGFSNVLVRLFHEKLGSQDIQCWAAQQCGESDANVRHLLLSVEEWRTKGRMPSLLLRNVLKRYLKDELEMFNSGLPADVPRLTVPTAAPEKASTGSTPTTDGNIWADVDRTAFALAHADQFHRGDSDEPYIIGLVQRASIGGGADGSINSLTDNSYTEYIQQDILQRFQADLARIVGRGIPESIVSERTMKNNRGLERMSGNVTPLVRVQELAKLLSKVHVTEDNISLVVRGLAQCPEKEPLNGLHDFAVPVSLIMSWTGPSSSGSAGAFQQQRGGHGSSNSVQQQILGNPRQRGGNGGGNPEKMVVEVLEELAWSRDGHAADIFYAIQQNRANPTLQQEFMNAFLPVYENDFKKVQEKFEDYTAGKFVPNITVAIEAFVKFLARISKHPEQLTSAVEYFEKDEIQRLDGSGATGQYTQIRLLPPHLGPFQFESTLVESIETVDQFRRYGIQAGPTRAPMTAFIAANSKSLTYRTHREKDVVYVTSADDQGLSKALRTSPAFKDITSNPTLAHLLKESNGHQYPGLIASFNRFFYRVTPMLSFYQKMMKDYAETVPLARAEAQVVNFGLSRALESEASTTIEQDFRRNAERYWRNVLEGRSAEEASLMGGGRARASSSAVGRRPPQQSGSGGRSSSTNQRSSTSDYILANAIGRRPAAATATAPKSADGTAASSNDRNPSSAPAASHRGGASGASRASTSNDVKSLLGALKGSAKGGSVSPSGRSNSNNSNSRAGGGNRPRGHNGSRPNGR